MSVEADGIRDVWICLGSSFGYEYSPCGLCIDLRNWRIMQNLWTDEHNPIDMAANMILKCDPEREDQPVAERNVVKTCISMWDWPIYLHWGG